MRAILLKGSGRATFVSIQSKMKYARPQATTHRIELRTAEPEIAATDKAVKLKSNKWMPFPKEATLVCQKMYPS